MYDADRSYLMRDFFGVIVGEGGGPLSVWNTDEEGQAEQHGQGRRGSQTRSDMHTPVRLGARSKDIRVSRYLSWKRVSIKLS